MRWRPLPPILVATASPPPPEKQSARSTSSNSSNEARACNEHPARAALRGPSGATLRAAPATIATTHFQKTSSPTRRSRQFHARTRATSAQLSRQGLQEPGSLAPKRAAPGHRRTGLLTAADILKTSMPTPSQLERRLWKAALIAGTVAALLLPLGQKIMSAAIPSTLGMSDSNRLQRIESAAWKVLYDSQSEPGRQAMDQLIAEQSRMSER